MALQLTRTTRYVRSWLTGHADVVEEETTLDRDGIRVPATIIRPACLGEALHSAVCLSLLTNTSLPYCYQFHSIWDSLVICTAPAAAERTQS